MPDDRPHICSAVNYSPSSIFTSLREVWKPLASPSSAAPAASHHQSLASQKAYLLMNYSELGDKLFPMRSQRLRREGAFGRSTGVPGKRCLFLSDPSALWQSALSAPIYSNITTDPPAAAALSSVSLVGFYCGKVKWQPALFSIIQLLGCLF